MAAKHPRPMGARYRGYRRRRAGKRCHPKDGRHFRPRVVKILHHYRPRVANSWLHLRLLRGFPLHHHRVHHHPHLRARHLHRERRL